MSTTPIETLEELLAALGRERSLRGRLRVIGQSWQLLRSLSRREREQVALRMGSSWAWQRLEKSFLGDGELGETEQLIGRVFDRMGDSDPQELRELAEMVRERDGGGLRDTLMITLREALEDEAREGLMQARPETSPQPEAPSDLETSRPQAEVVDTAKGVLTSTIAREIEPPEEGAAPVPEAAPAEAPARRPPEPDLPRPDPALAEEPRGERGTDPNARNAVPALAPSLGHNRLAILRELDRNPGAASQPEGRAELIAALGGGWASRRALTRMIQSGSLTDLDEALDLVDRLDRPGARTWCLADLVHYWQLDESALGRVLAAAPTEAARRRLAARARS